MSTLQIRESMLNDINQQIAERRSEIRELEELLATLRGGSKPRAAPNPIATDDERAPKRAPKTKASAPPPRSVKEPKEKLKSKRLGTVTQLLLRHIAAHPGCSAEDIKVAMERKGGSQNAASALTILRRWSSSGVATAVDGGYQLSDSARTMEMRILGHIAQNPGCQQGALLVAVSGKADRSGFAFLILNDVEARRLVKNEGSSSRGGKYILTKSGADRYGALLMAEAKAH